MRKVQAGMDRELSWDHIHKQWKFFCEGLDSPVVDEPDFLKIKRIFNPDYFDFVVDWRPKNEIEKIRNFRYKPDSAGVRIELTKAGTLHTANILWEAKGNIEKQHAIYMLASLREKERELPIEWRGDIYRLIAEVERVIKNQFPDIGGWHHASKEAMPIDMMRYIRHGKMILPQNHDDLIYITAVESVLAEANWQLIEYVEELPKNFRLEQIAIVFNGTIHHNASYETLLE